MRGSFLTLVIVIALFMIAVLFIPVIFGSMESNIDRTNNTTNATYQTVTPLVITGQFLFWVGAVLCGILLIVGVLYFRR